MLLLRIKNCMDSIYLLDCIYNNYNDTINYIFIYYN